MLYYVILPIMCVVFLRLDYTMLYFIILAGYITLHYIMLYYTILFYNILYCIALCHIIV